eukprot:600235-Prorocentrum_minimum.AAC.1
MALQLTVAHNTSSRKHHLHPSTVSSSAPPSQLPPPAQLVGAHRRAHELPTANGRCTPPEGRFPPPEG